MSLTAPVIRCGLTATEVITDTSLNTNARSVQHTVFNREITPSPAVIYSGHTYALVDGAATIDLRDLRTVAGGAGDANGYKAQGVYFKNLGANVMTIAPGASNGYALFGAGNEIDVPPGGVISASFNDGTPDVASDAKEIDVTGTGTQTFECGLILG